MFSFHQQTKKDECKQFQKTSYEKKVNNSTNINKANTKLSAQIIEHISDHNIINIEIKALAWDIHKHVVGLSLIYLSHIRSQIVVGLENMSL
jgi:hypothetical protein